MNVREARKTLRRLEDHGYGDVELIFVDVRSGDTGSVSIYPDIAIVDEESQYDQGRLADTPAGTKYVGVYCDH